MDDDDDEKSPGEIMADILMQISRKFQSGPISASTKLTHRINKLSNEQQKRYLETAEMLKRIAMNATEDEKIINKPKNVNIIKMTDEKAVAKLIEKALEQAEKSKEIVGDDVVEVEFDFLCDLKDMNIDDLVKKTNEVKFRVDNMCRLVSYGKFELGRYVFNVLYWY